MKNHSFISILMICLMAFTSAYAESFATGPVDYSKLKPAEDMAWGTLEQRAMDVITDNEAYRYYIDRMMMLHERATGKLVIRNKTAPFLVRICSSYFDEATKKWATVQGLGSIVNFKSQGKMYSAVLTVSHLTQGQQLKIYNIRGEPLAIMPGQRLANIDEDVELIVLKEVQETPFSFGIFRSGPRAQGLFFSVFPLSKEILLNDIETTPWDRFYMAPKQHVPFIKNELPKGSEGIEGYTWFPEQSMALYNLMKKKKIEDGREYYRMAWDETSVLSPQMLGHGYVANAHTPPGLSGAPLIRDVPTTTMLDDGIYGYQIDGLVQGHHRFQKKSFFVGRESLQDIMVGFRERGKRGYTSETRWRLRNGMTFRDFGKGVLETSFVKTPSASFYKGESGNAISVDGDQGVTPIDIGMQSGGTTVVGSIVEMAGKKFPVLMDPLLNDKMPGASKTTFGPQQDLLGLAKIKYEYRDQIGFNDGAKEKCIYQVSDAGINLKLSGEKVNFNWNGNSQQLKNGFTQNPMVFGGTKGQPTVEISGLFLTDLSSLPAFDNLITASAPTVTVVVAGVSKKVNCFASEKERLDLYESRPSFILLDPNKELDTDKFVLPE